MSIKWHLEKRKLGELKKYQNNPHYNSVKDNNKLDYSFEEIGFCSIIVINTDNVILSGNMRYDRLFDMYGAEHIVDCYVPNKTLNDAEQKKVVLLMNSACSSKQINQNIIDNYFNSLDIDYNLLDIKVNNNEQYDIDEQPNIADLIKFNYNIIIQAKDEKEQRELYEKLTKQGYNCLIQTI